MPIGMPYYLEKGPTLRLMEQFLNTDPKGTLQTLCDSNATVEKWLLGLKLWNHAELKRRQTAQGIVKDWFGLVQDPAGGPWTRPQAEKTTGYWTAYRGQVDQIVRTTLCWALQIAIGCDEEGKGAPGGANRPWPIELFWFCAADWFEGWVISRPVAEGAPAAGQPPAKTNPGRGLVTVVFVTPGHRGSVVARSPLAVAGKADEPKWLHPVPSRERDYEKIVPPPVDPQNREPQPPRDRRFVTWVVTHRRHLVLDAAGNPVSKRNTVESDYGAVVPPPGAVYSGYQAGGKNAEPVVIVAPSMPSGGVRVDGTVHP